MPHPWFVQSFHQYLCSKLPRNECINNPSPIFPKWFGESWSDGVSEIPIWSPTAPHLREILLQGLNKNIHFGKELTDWKELDNDEVELSFADGTTYTADLVIAADGVHSRIGKEYCKDQKVNTGNITIYGRTFYSPEALKAISPELQKGTSVIRKPVFSDRRCHGFQFFSKRYFLGYFKFCF
jgi:hypothetical protein